MTEYKALSAIEQVELQKEVKALRRREAELSAYVGRLRSAAKIHATYSNGLPKGYMKVSEKLLDKLLSAYTKTPPQSLHDRDMRIAEAVRDAIYRGYKGRAEGESVGWIINNTNLHTILEHLHHAP